MTKLFTKVKTKNYFGKDVTIYRSIDAKVTIELQKPLDGGYWWTKFTQKYGPGNDGAINLPDSQCLAIAAIFRDIERENKKILSKN